MYDLETGRRELSDCIRKWVTDPPPGKTLIHASLGLGKTHALIDALHHLPDGQQIILAFPTTELAREAMEKSNKGFFVRGRCEENCIFYEQLEYILHYGLMAKKVICQDCEHKEKCSFFIKIDQAKSEPVLFTTHQMACFLAGSSDFSKSSIIFDESPIDTIYKQLTATREQVEAVYDFVNMPEKLRVVTGTMDSCIGRHKDAKNRTHATVSVFTGQVIKGERRVGYISIEGIFKDSTKKSSARLDHAISHGVNFMMLAVKAGLYFGEKENKMTTTLNHQVAYRNGLHRAANVMMDMGSKFEIDYIVTENKGKVVCKCSRVEKAILPESVLVLDGTPIPHSMKFDREHKFIVKEDWGKAILSKTQMGKTAANNKKKHPLIKKIADQVADQAQGKVLCITKKAIEEQAGEWFPSWTVAHYGNIRGINSYQDNDTVILLLNNKIGFFDAVLKFIYLNDREFDLKKYKEFNDSFVRAEYLQAMARVRPLNHPGEKTVICCLEGWPLDLQPDVTVAAGNRTERKVGLVRQNARYIFEELKPGECVTRKVMAELLGRKLSDGMWTNLRQDAAGLGFIENKVPGRGRAAIQLQKPLSV